MRKPGTAHGGSGNLFSGGTFMQKMIIAVVAICAIAGVAITAVSVPLER